MLSRILMVGIMLLFSSHGFADDGSGHRNFDDGSVPSECFRAADPRACAIEVERKAQDDDEARWRQGAGYLNNPGGFSQQQIRAQQVPLVNPYYRQMVPRVPSSYNGGRSQQPDRPSSNPARDPNDRGD